MPSEFTLQNRLHDANKKSALSEGFFDTLGSEKRFVAHEINFSELENILLKYGELFVKEFQSELDKQDVSASGVLDNSIRFDFVKMGTAYETTIYMADYAKFVDLGVQGVDSSKNINTTSPYKFKFIYPTKSHIEALEKWIKEKNVTAIITVPKGIISKTLSPKSLAYAIGIATKKRGLKATYFKMKAINKLENNLRAEIAAAIGRDLTINILY